MIRRSSRSTLRPLVAGAVVALAAWALTPGLDPLDGGLVFQVDSARAQAPTPGRLDAPPVPTGRRAPPAAPATPPAAAGAPTMPFAGLTADKQALVTRVETYLNGVTTMKARFTQVTPNGAVASGTYYVRRPGRLRFEYDPPAELLVVADGLQVTMVDYKTRDFSQWPIGWTAASFLAAETIRLSGDITVSDVTTGSGDLRITLFQTKRPNEGKVELVLSDTPTPLLRGWTIVDGKGGRVQVGLQSVETGINLGNVSFRFDETDLRRRTD